MFYQMAHYNNQSVGYHFGCHVRFLIYRASYPTHSLVVPQPKPRQERVRFGSGPASPVGVKVHRIYTGSPEVRCYLGIIPWWADKFSWNMSVVSTNMERGKYRVPGLIRYRCV